MEVVDAPDLYMVLRCLSYRGKEARDGGRPGDGRG